MRRHRYGLLFCENIYKMTVQQKYFFLKILLQGHYDCVANRQLDKMTLE